MTVPQVHALTVGDYAPSSTGYAVLDQPLKPTTQPFSQVSATNLWHSDAQQA
jgi:hypothetical protein